MSNIENTEEANIKNVTKYSRHDNSVDANLPGRYIVL